MATTSNITCPISVERVNENIARIIAFFVIATSLLALFLHSYIIILALAFDFALRSFIGARYSPLRLFSLQLTQVFNIKNKPTDAAPKKFAAGLGFAFSLAIAVFLFAGFNTAAVITSALLIFCALLEGGFGICLGCYVYTLIVLPLLKR